MSTFEERKTNSTQWIKEYRKELLIKKSIREAEKFKREWERKQIDLIKEHYGEFLKIKPNGLLVARKGHVRNKEFYLWANYCNKVPKTLEEYDALLGYKYAVKKGDHVEYTICSVAINKALKVKEGF